MPYLNYRNAETVHVDDPPVRLYQYLEFVPVPLFLRVMKAQCEALSAVRYGAIRRAAEMGIRVSFGTRGEPQRRRGRWVVALAPALLGPIGPPGPPLSAVQPTEI